MKQKKNYEAPALEVVELKVQNSLLAGSSNVSSTGSFDEDASLENFGEWD